MTFKTKSTLFLTGALALAGVAGCEKPRQVNAAVAQPPASSSPQVSIDNFSFSPPELTVSAGTTVSWTNRDDVPHTATSTQTPPVFDSHALDTDQKFSFTFTTPGTYAYFCEVHPKMTGKIIVK